MIEQNKNFVQSYGRFLFAFRTIVLIDANLQKLLYMDVLLEVLF